MKGQEVSAEYLGVAEAEALTNVSRWTWRRWAYDGKVGSVKLGKRLLIPTSEIQRLIAENSRPRLESGEVKKPEARAGISEVGGRIREDRMSVRRS